MNAKERREEERRAFRRESTNDSIEEMIGGTDIVGNDSGLPDKKKGLTRTKDAFWIEVDRVMADPNQPRRFFAEASDREMADSLLELGQLQPMLGYWSEENKKWIIIIGERRWRGAKLAGIKSVMMIEYTGSLNPSDIFERQLVENIQRADLSPIELAFAFQKMIEQRKCSVRALGERLKVARQTIENHLNLLEFRPEIFRHIEAGRLNVSVAMFIRTIEDATLQQEVADIAANEELTAAQAKKLYERRMATQVGAAPGGSQLPSPPPPPTENASQESEDGGPPLASVGASGLSNTSAPPTSRKPSTGHSRASSAPTQRPPIDAMWRLKGNGTAHVTYKRGAEPETVIAAFRDLANRLEKELKDDGKIAQIPVIAKPEAPASILLTTPDSSIDAA